MLTDIALITFVMVAVYVGRYLIDHWYSGAPPPDGLVEGEQLVASMAAWLTIDDSPASGAGFAYLTNLRLVWTPNLNSWHVKNAPPGTPYTEPVIIALGEIRKVDARFYFGGSRLLVEATDIRLGLVVQGRSLGRWERYIVANASRMLPPDQPHLRSRNRYSPQEVLTVSKGSGTLIVVLLIFIGMRILENFVDWRGDSITWIELIAFLGLLAAVGVGIYLWEMRSN